MVRTRVGYAGGSKPDPTYTSLGDHSETVQIEYDPDVISYADLLDVFWEAHSPTSAPWSRQYMSIILYHNDEQRRLAEESKRQREQESGRRLYTEIVPHSRFYLAEDYHQKYYLRRETRLMADLRRRYPDEDDLVRSTAAARLNGYLAGYGSLAQAEAELESLGLSPEGEQRLLEVVSRYHRR